MVIPKHAELTLNVRALLDIIDFDKSAGKHASSIKGLCMEEVQLRLLEKYMSDHGHEVELLGIPCTSKGKWLDAWMRWIRNGNPVLMQIEVKSWSMHGYGGGKQLDPDAWDDELREYKQREWAKTWNTGGQCFFAEGLDKVRRRMRTDHIGEVVPVACLWSAMHPKGDLNELMFDVGTKGDFDLVKVFSASAYLRHYMRDRQTEWITLELPKTRARLQYMTRIFGFEQIQGSKAGGLAESA